MPDQAQGAQTVPVAWHTGQDYNHEEGLHLWTEVGGARIEIRKRVSRLLGRASNGYRVWEVFVEGKRRAASHPSLRAAKEAVEGRSLKPTGAKREGPPPAPLLWDEAGPLVEGPREDHDPDPP